MNDSEKSRARFPQWKRYAWVLAVVWTVVVAASLVWNVVQVRHNTLEAARIQARVAHGKDVIYRRWNAGHGGVYVPVTEVTKPNPYLSDMPERDITTPSGKLLTLMNPAYMTRQVHELAEEEYGVRGHITSLKPIRPENAPDPWETEALQAFERGETEISSVEEMEGEEYMRLMRPLITEKGCLKCHAAQGYQEGDIRGGISVSIPLEPLWAVARMQVLTLAGGHAMLWLMGLGGIVLGTHRLRRSEQERKRAEEALRESSQLLQRMYDAIPDAILIHDAKLNIVSCNQSVQRVFGYTPNELIGKHYSILVSEEMFIDLKQKAREAELFEKGYLEQGGFLFKKKNGESFPGSFAVALLRDEEGNFAGTVGTARDITERKRAEEALKEYSERLEEMVEERTEELRDAQARLIQSEKLAATGRLAASVAHEISNPLQGIGNYLSLISQQVAQDDPLHEDLDMVKLGFDRIAEIVRRLRAFYRPAGEGMEPTDINGVVKRVLALVGHQLSLGNVEVKTELAEQELPVLGSAGQLEQVLVNLALNAQNAMPEGGELMVRTTLHEGVVQLQVSDTGQGMSEEEMSKLFKPFYSGRGGQGLGLGLWISHNIIEGHGGRIEVESQVGEGATFTISLPAYQRER